MTSHLMPQSHQTSARRAGGRTLLILPAFIAGIAAGGAFVLTRKFIDGVIQYVERWPGPVKVLIETADRPDDNLDREEVHPSELPFGLEPLPMRDAALVERLQQEPCLVSASLVDKHTRLGRLCRQAGIPLVVYTEYTLRTRKQIARVNTSNPLLQLRRQWWETRLERRCEAVMRTAAGLQCNGTPTYDAYRNLNPRTLLYFDTRIRREMLASEEDLHARIAEMKAGRPLRLAFSGRLILMKGADHLALVAAELDRMGVPFTMEICGGGALEQRIAAQIAKHNLGDRVRLRGVLDFRTQLVPLIARHVDLFVCCHRQGDPSCTYLETMSCGTPIAGYANEAMEGLVRTSQVGWHTPLDDPRALARCIAALHVDRSALADAAFRARAFAAQHTFELTMEARVNHLIACGAIHAGSASC